MVLEFQFLVKTNQNQYAKVWVLSLKWLVYQSKEMQCELIIKPREKQLCQWFFISVSLLNHDSADQFCLQMSQ